MSVASCHPCMSQGNRVHDLDFREQLQGTQISSVYLERIEMDVKIPWNFTQGSRVWNMLSRVDVVPACLAIQRRPKFRPTGTYPGPSRTVGAISSWRMQGKLWSETLRRGRTSTRRSDGMGVTMTGETDVAWVASILYVP